MVAGIKILHLEDNLLDAELIHDIIYKEFENSKIVHVRDRNSFIENLPKNYDVILCDYHIPSFNGIEALSLVIENKIDIPFIFISGTIGEERAVTLLKMGATDYLLKNNLTRLTSSIKRALEEYKIKRQMTSAQRELAKAAGLYRTLAGNIPNSAVFLFDEKLHITLAEGQLAQLTTLFKKEQLIDKPVSEVMNDDNLKQLMPICKEVFNGEACEIELKHEDKFYAFTCHPVEDNKGKILSGLLMVQDITQRKLSEEQLIIAKEKAEESDKLKSEFLAQISHEIRTPISSIINFSQMLKEELSEIHPEFNDVFSGVDGAGKRIIRTIDLLINISMIQTGRYHPNFQKINLNTILKRLMSEFMSVAILKKIELWFKNNGQYYVIADEYTVYQIFQNLIDNALKFTDEGSVEVFLYNKGKNVAIDIKDTGIGMSPGYVETIYTPFSQESTGYSRHYEGNGLGLALTKNYVALNNAQIEINSRKGEGTTFTIIFKGEE